MRLLGGFARESLDDGDVGKEVFGKSMPLAEVCGRIPGDRDLTGGVLGDEEFEWEVDRYRGRGQHQRRTAFGIAKDHDLGGRHVQARRCGLAAMVDDGEELDAPGGQDCSEAGDGVVDRVVRWDGDQAGVLG
jgi:hypothetical protein